MSGHKTDIASQRYNLVTEEEILGMRWVGSRERWSKNDGHLYGNLLFLG